MKNISKSGIFDNLKDFEISDKKNLDILNFFEKSHKQRINIGNNNKFTYNVFVEKEINFDINIFAGSKNKGTINLLCLCADFEIIGNVNINMICDDNNIKLNIIGLIGENGKINCTGNFLINSKTKGNIGDLFQDNIFLSEKGKVSVAPKLNIYSHQSNSSHGVKIQRLDNEKLFYIKSRGIGEPGAKELMIYSYFKSFFEKFNIKEEKIKGYLTFLSQKCQTL